MHADGIGAVPLGATGGPPSWAMVVALESEVAADNADVGSLSYVTNSRVRGKMKVTPKVASTDSKMLWETGAGNAPLNGYPVSITNMVPCNLTKGGGSNLSAMIFGNWSNLLMGIWSGLDLLVDPFSGSTNGKVRVAAFQSVDFTVRHPESFAACTDITTS